MKISETDRLILRTLAGKPFYQSAQGPILAGILESECRTHEHRVRVCQRALLMRFGEKQEDRCPGPAELADLCREVSPIADAKEAKADCRFCFGYGFEVGAGAVRCRCGGFPMADDSRAAANAGRVSEDPEMRNLVANLANRRAL